MEEFLMKILFATATLVALLSLSAYAQYGPWRGYYRAYAQAPYFRTPGFYDLYGRRSPYPYSVYDVRGTYIGSDPDPRVRSQLGTIPHRDQSRFRDNVRE